MVRTKKIIIDRLDRGILEDCILLHSGILFLSGAKNESGALPKFSNRRSNVSGEKRSFI